MTASERWTGRYVVTGPGGWIGSALLGLLAHRLGPDWRRHVLCFGSQARAHRHPAGDVEVRALSDIAAADVDGARVFHLAYLTKDKIGESGDGAFIEKNFAIDDLVLRAVGDAPPAALFVASSGAAAGADRRESRNLYGVAKLVQEDRFLDLGAKRGARVLAGRIFNIAGPYINKIESYALSSFLAQGLLNGRITIAARQPVFRSYLDVDDLLSLVLSEMAGPSPAWAAPVDLCGPHVVEVQDVAEAAAASLGLDPAAVIARGPVDYARISRYLGDPTPACAMALKHGLRLRSFEAQVSRTAAYLKALNHA